MRLDLLCFAACAGLMIAPPALPAQELDFAARFAAAQKLAVMRFPALGRADSELNQRFLMEYRWLKAADAPLLKNPTWPVHLAQRCAADMGLVAPPTARLDPAKPKKPAWMSQGVSSLSTGSLSSGSLSGGSLFTKLEEIAKPAEASQPEAAPVTGLVQQDAALPDLDGSPAPVQKPAPPTAPAAPAGKLAVSSLSTGSLQVGSLH